MSFRYPVLLVILEVLPVLLLVWIWAGRRHGVPLPMDHSLARHGRWWSGVVNVANSLPVLLLAVIIAMLCGPQQLSEPKTRRKLTNIQLCVDISGSMTAQFGEGTRYDASMEAINEFLDFREGDAFGLTFFGNNVLHWVPLTSDRSAVRCSPPFMSPEVVPPWFGGTEIAKALRACQKVLVEREEGDRMIILISDGFSSDLSAGNDEQIAMELRADGIVVYAIHIDSSEVPDPIVNITSLTGGEVFHPGDLEGLKAVFRRIDAMQQAELEKIAAESMDNYFPFSCLGLGLLGLALVCSFGLRYTPW